MPEAKRRDLFPGALEMMVLRLIEEAPAHGYALVQRIRERSRNLLEVEEGSLYPALQRLLRAGLVRASWEVSGTGRRVRTYRLTPAGARHLTAEVSRFQEMLRGVSWVVAPGET
ncbi:MAG TPA: PadR family transcriptional regulator [Gemmatimonadales bacterium]|nr:PadR family transcriptional regulator [Gemmatimonadales bacterium]